MNLRKTFILNEIKNHYGFIKDKDFARFLGVTPQVLSNWYARNTFYYEILYTKCLDIDAEWLFTGDGDMLKKKSFGKDVDQVGESDSPYGSGYKEKYIAQLEDDNKRLQHQIKALQKIVDEKQDLIDAFLAGDIVIPMNK